MKTTSRFGGKRQVLHALLIATLPLWERLYNHTDFYPIGIGIWVTGLICVFRLWRNPTIHLSLTDGAAFFCLAFFAVRTVHPESPVFSEWIMVLYAAMVYMLARLADKEARNSLCYGLWLGGILQSVLVWLQVSGVCSSQHRWFDATGSFLNPAPLGAWLALAMLVAFRILLYSRLTLRRKLVGWTSLLMMGGALVIADSRSAFLSLGVGAIMIWMERVRVRYSWHWAAMIVAILIVILPLYKYRQSSADARIFIWKVCAEMVKDAPLWGHGPQGVKRNYMHYQTSYLETQGTAEERIQATDNVFAFNEGLRTCCEYGLVGLLLVVLVLFFAWRESKPENPFRHLLVGWLVFSCFSYPMSVFSLITVFILMVGCLPDVATYKLHANKRKGAWIMGTFMFVGMVYLCIYRDASRSLDYLIWEKDAEEKWQRYYPMLRNEKDFVSRYANTLFLNGEYETAIEPLHRLTRMAPTVEVFCNLGYCLQQKDNAEGAEACFRYASSMAPGRIIPHYRLFCLYRSLKDKDRMKEEGQRIMGMEVKIENERVKRIRHEVRKELRSLGTYERNR